MGRRKQVSTPLGDPSRRPYALPHVKRKQLKAELKALQALTPEQVRANVERVQQALQAAGLGGEG